MRVLRVSLLAACLIAALAAVTPAHAGTGRCFGEATGPMCHVVTGKVTAVNDGDTIRVDVAGDRRRPLEIRLRAVQAMELTRYNRRNRRGQCHSVEATVALERLLRRSGNRVRLATQIRDGRDPLGRYRRAVAIRSGGRWRDVGEILIARGHALWLTNASETIWNARYNRAQQEAAQRGKNLWNPTHCGRGPQQDVPIDVWVSWDAFGTGAANANGEWIKIRNRGAQTLNIGRWWVRDAMLRRFTFPRGTTVAPGATVTVYVGPGRRSPGVFHWGLDRTIFENASGDGRDLGDGAYLFDPRGDLRAHMLYPCVVACTDPRQGAVVLRARARRPESITLLNVSLRSVDLHGTQLALSGSAYDFRPGSVLGPGEAMVVEVAGDPSDDTRTRRHWGADGYMLRDRGDAIRLQTYSSIVLACDSWGNGNCSQ